MVVVGVLDLPGDALQRVVYFLFLHNLDDTKSYRSIGTACRELRNVQMQNVSILLCVLSRSSPTSTWAPALLLPQDEVDAMLGFYGRPMNRPRLDALRMLLAATGGMEMLWQRRKQAVCGVGLPELVVCCGSRR